MNTRDLKNILRTWLGEGAYYRIAKFRRDFRKKDSYGGKSIIRNDLSAAKIVRKAFASGNPIALSRVGGCEMRFIKEFEEIQTGERGHFSEVASQEIYVNAGVHPVNNTTAAYFHQTYSECVPFLDFISVCFNAGEERFIVPKSPNATLIQLPAVDPLCFAGDSWVNELAGKRVLVVSPFVTTIETQFAKRDEVWERCPNFLPDFELITVRAPLSAGLTRKPEFTSWVEALDHLRAEMSRISFDVAIIGAGAYSLPLAVHAKKMGAIGIHLGGATQLIFGIMGGRWETNPGILKFQNEHWVRPSGDEVPPNVNKVEGGCYW